LLLGVPAPAASALKDPVQPVPKPSAPVEVDALLLAIQSLLAEMGLYHGALDGRLTPATIEAIKLHQKAWNMRQTGQPSEDLLQHLEMVAGMRRIERRLKQTKAEQISGAKRLIEESPATRRLLIEASARPLPKVSDPKTCFVSPKPECLSVLARQAALTAPAGSMRDWALSEVASEAAEAGVPQMAWEVASRIDDPRTLIAALEAVARSLAEGGHFRAALEALDAIPELGRRCEAALVLALRQAEKGQVDGAKAARAEAERMLGNILQPEDALSARLKLSEISLRLGEEGNAVRWRIEAEKRLLLLPSDARQSAMASLSMIETQLKHFDASRQWLLQIHDGLLRVPAELKLIEAMAREGRGAEADVMAKAIDLPRYRVLAHVHLSRAARVLGQIDEAGRQLRVAGTLVQTIDLPFARAYGESQIALGWMELGDSQTAEAQALAIDDEALKAQTLWRMAAIAPDLRKAALAEEAQAATLTYADPFGRVWMHAELARESKRMANPSAAREHLARGIATAETIKDSWSRSRALAALAGALAELLRP
jgi:hypothetical protein